MAPDTQAVSDARLTDNVKVITSAGISAGIDMSLYVIGRLLGREAADSTAACMEYREYSGV